MVKVAFPHSRDAIRIAMAGALLVTPGLAAASGAIASPAVFLPFVAWYYPVVYVALLLGAFRRGVVAVIATVVTLVFDVVALAIVYATVVDFPDRRLGSWSSELALFVVAAVVIAGFALVAPVMQWWGHRHGRPIVQRTLVWLVVAQALSPLAWMAWMGIDSAIYRDKAPKVEALGRSAKSGELAALLHSRALGGERYLLRFATGLARSELIHSEARLGAQDEAAVREVVARLPQYYVPHTTLSAKLVWDEHRGDWETLIDAFVAKRILNPTGLEFIVRHAPARYCRGSDPQTMREYVRQRYPHLSYYDAPKRVLALIDAICADGAPGGTREPVEG